MFENTQQKFFLNFKDVRVNQLTASCQLPARYLIVRAVTLIKNGHSSLKYFKEENEEFIRSRKNV